MHHDSAGSDAGHSSSGDGEGGERMMTITIYERKLLCYDVATPGVSTRPKL